MELEVRHLRVICVIADKGSLTRAAAALNMTQPGLSAQLRRIETMLGGLLFERQTNGVEPTRFGDYILSRAKAVLPTLDDLMNSAAMNLGADALRFRLGTVLAPLLGGLITAVRTLHPDATITSRGPHTTMSLVDDVSAGRLEAAVVGDSPGYEFTPPGGVVLREIATEPVFALLPAAHPLARSREVDLAELIAEDWAVPQPEDRTAEYWSRVAVGAGLRPHIVYEAAGKILVDLVRHGHAVSLCQATFDEVPGIVVRPIAGDPLWYRHLVAWHREGPLADTGDALITELTARYEDIVASSPAYSGWRADRGADRIRSNSA